MAPCSERAVEDQGLYNRITLSLVPGVGGRDGVKDKARKEVGI